MSHRAAAAFCAALTWTVAAQAQTTESVLVFGERGRGIDVPQAQVTLSNADLDDAGITGLFQLNQVVPGFRADRYGGSTQMTLRGIGIQNVLGPGVASPVAIYVDGFYQTGLDASLFDFADLTQVELLKGPQGTQFGRNANAGALLLTTADPAFESAARAAASYGSFNDRRLQFYGTTALSDTLAANLSLYRRDSDNFLRDSATGAPSAPLHDTAVRGKLLFAPRKDLRFVLAAQYRDSDDPTSLALVVRQPVASFYHDAFGVPQVHTLTPLTTSLDKPIHADPQSWSLSLTGEADLGFATLVSRSLFRSERGRVQSDLDGTTINYWYTDYLQTDQTVTQELDLLGRDPGPLQWQAGFYYENDLAALGDHTSQDIFNTGTATDVFATRLRVATNSAALFGTLGYQLAPDWTATAGLRLTHESKAMRSQMLIAPFVPGADAHDWNDASGKISLRHALGADSSLYATISRGVMAGNYNYLGAGPQSPVRPERTTQYEAGYSRAGADWSWDSDVYVTDYRDLQAYTYMSSCGCFQFSNVPSANIWGAEAQGHLALTGTLSLNGGLAFTHARYGAFTGESPTGAPFLPPTYGFATGPTNFSGGAMIRSPDWTGNIGAQWRTAILYGTVGAAANLYFTSTVPFTPDRQLTQAGYGLVNLTLDWTSPSQSWVVTATGENVADRRYQTFSAEGFLGNSIAYGAPASWILRVARSL